MSDFPPIGAPVEVLLDKRGPWILGTVSAHDPGRGFEVKLSSGGSSHTANPRCEWRRPAEAPPPPVCEICGEAKRRLCDLSIGDPPEIVKSCETCAGQVGGVVIRRGVGDIVAALYRGVGPR